MAISNIIRLFLVLTLAVGGCKKQVPGPKGEPGQDGGRGNLRSTHVSRQAVNWTPGSNGWECTLDIPEITGNVLAKGQVEVYMETGDQWWKLPYTVGNLFTQAFTDAGKIKLKHAMIHDGPPPRPGTVNFNIMISEPVQ